MCQDVTLDILLTAGDIASQEEQAQVNPDEESTEGGFSFCQLPLSSLDPILRPVRPKYSWTAVDCSCFAVEARS